MKTSKGFILVVFGLFAFALSHQPTPVKFSVPEGWPQPEYDFSQNPLTEEGIALGRALFYDPILSRDSSTSCQSCHLSFTAFTHVDHKISHGIEDRIGIRNSPALMNLAWSKHFMWDGAFTHLDMQALAPISSPSEMDEDFKHVVAKVQGQKYYRTLFAEAFGDSTVTGERFLKALSQFQLTFVSSNSRFDKWKRGEPSAFFSDQEKNGYELFKAHCNSCHTEPLFTNGGFAQSGLAIDTILQDSGRYRVTGKESDIGLFKVPTLRNLTFSFPYMHDGRFSSLHQVLAQYSSGKPHGRSIQPKTETMHTLSPEEQVDIVAFLLTLSDRNFTLDRRFMAPQLRH